MEENEMTTEYEVVDLDYVLGSNVLRESEILNSLELTDPVRQKVVQNYEFLHKLYCESNERARELNVKERDIALRERQFEHQVKMDEAKAKDSSDARLRDIDIQLWKINAELIANVLGVGAGFIKAKFTKDLVQDCITLERRDMGTLRTGALRLLSIIK